MRSFLFVLGLVIFSFNIPAFAKKSLKKALTQRIPVKTTTKTLLKYDGQSKNRPPKAVFVIFQQLGAEKHVPGILQTAIRIAQTHFHVDVVSFTKTKRVLPDFGIKQYGRCLLKTRCLRIRTTYNFGKGINKTLAMGVGSIGNRFLINFIWIDQKTGQAVRQNMNFQGEKELLDKEKGLYKFFDRHLLPKVILKPQGFPDKTKVVCETSRIKGGDKQNVPPHWYRVRKTDISVVTDHNVTCVFTAKGHVVFKYHVSRNSAGIRRFFVKMPRQVRVVIIRRRVIPPRPPGKKPVVVPVYKKPWFWAVIGSAVAVSAAVGITAGVVASSQANEQPKIELPIQ